jgi:hypothetical protein
LQVAVVVGQETTQVVVAVVDLDVLLPLLVAEVH